ncbi:MAG: ABC-ATPase domain-containing protein [Eubacteriales bacterium]|nr:ABC-ATPase domain-containing protein [Eubacteriales bacterium]
MQKKTADHSGSPTPHRSSFGAVRSSGELLSLLRSVDRKSYPAYKALTGSWRFPAYTLSIDHVQGDPFASPSHLTVHITLETAGFPAAFLDRDYKRTALSDYLLRRFGRFLSASSHEAKGSGKSGLLSISRCGQEILPRTACEINEKELAVRFHAGFPAAGRTILAGELEKILFSLLPGCIEKALLAKSIPQQELLQVIRLAEDQDFLRAELPRRGLVAFIADGSVLPRESGVSDRPMQGAVLFSSPESLAVTISLPYKGNLRGMGIPKGITLIAGGGYHGKSTVLKALERGVYNHISGDGREYVITDASAVKIRAEDGRKISGTDISLFIHDLPNKKDTKRFSTPDASGSTSQAANISEAIEAGSHLFLIDEDTSATNFMIRDELMQKVISREKEPITPFLERARALYEEADISSILVVGSSGAYFYLADHIIQMDAYRPLEITERVRALCRETTAPDLSAPGFHLPDTDRRLLFLQGTDAGQAAERNGRPGYERGRGRSQVPGAWKDDRPARAKIRLQGTTAFSLDHTNVDLRYLEQLTDAEQTAALAHLLRYVSEHYREKKLPASKIAEELSERLSAEGFSFLFENAYCAAGLALPRRQEILACLLRV